MSTVVQANGYNRTLPAVENSLLSALPAEEYARLLPELERVHLKYDEVIYEHGETIRHVYFPKGAVASLLALLEDGTTVEVGMVGRHGLIGASVILEADTASYWTLVEIEGEAARMCARAFKGWLRRSETLRRLLASYYQSLVTQFCQRAVCNCRHMTVQRLCTWLLMVQDRRGASEFPLTQDLVARRLGSRRATVTKAYNQLQSAGAVSHGRGHVTIRDRGVLRNLACECYPIMAGEAPGFAGV